MLQYKGYTADIAMDAIAGVLHGRVRNIRDIITFEAKTPEEVEQEFQKSVDAYLNFCRTLGQEPELPAHPSPER